MISDRVATSSQGLTRMLGKREEKNRESSGEPANGGKESVAAGQS